MAILHDAANVFETYFTACANDGQFNFKVTTIIHFNTDFTNMSVSVLGTLGKITSRVISDLLSWVIFEDF